MNKVLLDTDIFSEVLKGKDQKVIEKANVYLSKYKNFTISSITVMEIVKGFHRLKQDKRLMEVWHVFQTQEILEFDLESSLIAGRIYGDLENKGQPIGRADPMIAAIAIKSQISLITGNIKHFERIQKMGYKLKVENWRE